MSWTLSRYIGGRFLGVLAWSFAVVALIVFLGNLIELLREAAGTDAGFGQVTGLAALKSPTVALTALPFVVLLASLASFAQLARSSELVVTRAAGVSIWTMIAPTVALAALVGALGVGLFNPLAAATASRAERLETKLFEGEASRLSFSDEGLWLRQGGGDRQMVVHARGANADATELRDVTFFGFSPAGELVERIDAAVARLEPGAWALREAVQRRLDVDSGAVAETEEETATVPTELTRAQIADSFEQPEAISFWELPDFIRTLEASGFSALRHKLHYRSQLAAPLLFAGMAMLGAAFSMRHVRMGGLGWMAFGAVLTGFGLYFVTDVAKALGASGAVPTTLAAWSPPAATVLLAAGLLLHLEDG